MVDRRRDYGHGVRPQSRPGVVLTARFHRPAIVHHLLRHARRRRTRAVETGCATSATSSQPVRHMTTTISIDDRLLSEAQRIGGLRTKKATVIKALEEFIERR